MFVKRFNLKTSSYITVYPSGKARVFGTRISGSNPDTVAWFNFKWEDGNEMNEKNLKLLKEFVKKRKELEELRKTLNEEGFRVLDGIGTSETRIHLENIYNIVDEDAKINIEKYTFDGTVYKKTSAVVDGITIFHIEKVEDIETDSEDQ